MKLQERDPEFVAHGDEEMEAYDLQLPEASTELLKAGIRSIKFRVKGLLNELVQIMWLADKIIQEYTRIQVLVSSKNLAKIYLTIFSLSFH